jgi:two-component system OmpR family response regulator
MVDALVGVDWQKHMNRVATMDATPHILVVDDDREIRDLITRFLKKNGYRADAAANGKEMHSALVGSDIDLIVLDRVMPGEDGLNLCRDLRRESRVPIILLTLLGSDTDRIVGLEMGADDYLTKPFNPQELLARIKAVLRRANDLPSKSPLQRARRVTFSGWAVDRIARELTSPEGVHVLLTDGEFDLLNAFVEHPQLILTREQLLDLTRGRSAIAFDRSIDMQMTRLRRKIETNPDDPEFIKTVRNKGYIFTPEVVAGEE